MSCTRAGSRSSPVITSMLAGTSSIARSLPAVIAPAQAAPVETPASAAPAQKTPLEQVFQRLAGARSATPGHSPLSRLRQG